MLSGVGETRTNLVRMAAVAVAAMQLSACSTLPWAEKDAQLYSPVNGRVGVGIAGVAAGGMRSVGDVPVCVDVPGSVTITSVEPVEPTNGFSVIAFAVRTIPLGDAPLGDGNGDLASLGMTREEQGRKSVTEICGDQARANVGLDGPPPPGVDDSQRMDLAVTVSAPAMPASSRTLLIRYTDASGDERSTTSAFSIGLCDGNVDDPCDPP